MNWKKNYCTRVNIGLIFLMTDNRPRPPFKTGKDDVMLNAPSIYAQSISLIPSNTVGPQTQPNSKRTRSPSPPPQFYHAYKPHSLSSYNSSKFNNQSV